MPLPIFTLLAELQATLAQLAEALDPLQLHARRKIFEARTTAPKHADPLLALIAALYVVKAGTKGFPAEERKKLRAEKSAPVLAKIHATLLATRSDVLPRIAPLLAHQVEKLTPAGWKAAFVDQATAAAIPANL